MLTLQTINALAVLFWVLLLIYLGSVVSTAKNKKIEALKNIGKVKYLVHDTFTYLEMIYTWVPHFIPYLRRAGNRPANYVPNNGPPV